MTNPASVWAVLLLAMLTANLPFISQRLFGLVKLAEPKTLGTRVGELAVWYCVTGGIALLLEQRAGQIAIQTWEFYAITGVFFITLAFPGFVYRHLIHRRD